MGICAITGPLHLHTAHMPASAHAHWSIIYFSIPRVGAQGSIVLFQHLAGHFHDPAQGCAGQELGAILLVRSSDDLLLSQVFQIDAFMLQATLNLDPAFQRMQDPAIVNRPEFRFVKFHAQGMLSLLLSPCKSVQQYYRLNPCVSSGNTPGAGAPCRRWRLAGWVRRRLGGRQCRRPPRGRRSWW